MSAKQTNPKHCLSIEGLKKTDVLALFQQANQFLAASGELVPLISPLTPPPLHGVVVATIFLEPSTRTQYSFELAATYLGAHVLHFNLQSSSNETKQETIVDTLHNLEAMGVRCFVIRHNTPHAVEKLAELVRPDTAVVNGGDGIHAHPTQALLDTYTLWRRNPDFSQYRVAIVGDIAHSRVARSQMQALSLLGVPDVRVIAPPHLLPEDIGKYNVTCYDNLESGLDNANVVIALRLQKERMSPALLAQMGDFHQTFGITAQTLRFASPDAVIMHPGPVNYGVEITSDVGKGPHSLILQQVTNGVALRMALLAQLVKS